MLHITCIYTLYTSHDLPTPFRTLRLGFHTVRGALGVHRPEILRPDHLRGGGLQGQELRGAGERQDQLVGPEAPELLAVEGHGGVRQ